MGDCYGVSVDRIEKVLLAANEEIIRLNQALAEKNREIEALKKRVQRKPEEWESVCGECNGSGWR